jgi:hypothetical protein
MSPNVPARRRVGAIRCWSTELSGATAVLLRAERSTSSAAGGREVIGTAAPDRLAGTARRDLLIGRGGMTSCQLVAADTVRGGGGEDGSVPVRNDVVEACGMAADVTDCGPGTATPSSMRRT